jgi:starch synthase (maltosyl-transferring)
MAERRRKAPPAPSPAPADADPTAPEAIAAVDVMEGRVRAVIDALAPAIDGGRFPAKRIAGEPVRIEAHCLADGHDKLRVVLRWEAVPEG